MIATFVMPQSERIQWSDDLIASMPGKPFLREIGGAQIGSVVGAVRDGDGKIRVTVSIDRVDLIAEFETGQTVRQVSLSPRPAVKA